MVKLYRVVWGRAGLFPGRGTRERQSTAESGKATVRQSQAALRGATRGARRCYAVLCCELCGCSAVLCSAVRPGAAFRPAGEAGLAFALVTRLTRVPRPAAWEVQVRVSRLVGDDHLRIPRPAAWQVKAAHAHAHAYAHQVQVLACVHAHAATRVRPYYICGPSAPCGRRLRPS